MGWECHQQLGDSEDNARLLMGRPILFHRALAPGWTASGGAWHNELSGGLAEWLMAPVLKTGDVKAFGGSNPSPSASSSSRLVAPWPAGWGR